jgi:hypothetical protein
MSANPQIPALSASELAFIEQAEIDATQAFEVFRETGTLTANGTVSFTERIAGGNKLASLVYPGPWKRNSPVEASVIGLDGTVYQGQARGDRRLRAFLKALKIDNARGNSP